MSVYNYIVVNIQREQVCNYTEIEKYSSRGDNASSRFMMGWDDT